MAQEVKNLLTMQEIRAQSLSWEDPLEEEEMATHSSILAWGIPWTKESGNSPWDHREPDTTARLTDAHDRDALRMFGDARRKT